ncbi:MAG TPA: selenium cofactor biosynthesis protein YqeC [Anaerolineae bacterium]|nr:selenium cofactor biosynthesis protein YqeC [Anaerolineae bacterium]
MDETDGKPVVALVGAGGKSSLLFRLGDELAAAGKPALLTATTRLWASQIDRVPFSLLTPSESTLAFELPTSLRGYGQALALAGPAGEPGKLAGLAPETICRLAALDEVGAVVVEADGSRERPLKAPAVHEPAVPTCATHVVTVAGIAAVGQSLDDATVHRPEIAAALTGLRLGDTLTAEAVAALLAHPDGGRKGCPGHAAPLLYLNLALDNALDAADAQRRLAAARRIASIVLTSPPPAYRSVLIGSAQAADPVGEVHGRVAAVVLAAGGSRRLDGDLPKQLLPWQPGGTLVGRAADIALEAGTLNQVVVVTGHGAQQVQAALGDRSVRVVYNPDWQTGQSSSVAAGLTALAPDTSAVVFVLADQPSVLPATIDQLVTRHRQTLAPVVAPIYQGGQRGNPVLFDRRTFPELLALHGDTGGRPLLQRYGQQVEQVVVDAPLPQGIETMAEYWRIFPHP